MSDDNGKVSIVSAGGGSSNSADTADTQLLLGASTTVLERETAESLFDIDGSPHIHVGQAHLSRQGHARLPPAPPSSTATASAAARAPRPSGATSTGMSAAGSPRSPRQGSAEAERQETRSQGAGSNDRASASGDAGEQGQGEGEREEGVEPRRGFSTSSSEDEELAGGGGGSEQGRGSSGARVEEQVGPHRSFVRESLKLILRSQRTFPTLKLAAIGRPTLLVLVSRCSTTSSTCARASSR